MQIPKRRGEWKQKIGPADEYLTEDAIQEIKNDIERLEKNVRPHAVSELQRTREMGDLSENFAYSEAKARVARIDSALFHMKERLKYAKPIRASRGGIISVGSTVEVEVNGKRKTYQILGEQQVDLVAGRISYHSPVGSALMGKIAGDTVSLTINGKKVDYKIISVS